MAKIIRHDYGSIHDALNQMIIAEVKAALSLLPGKSMETDNYRVPLCRIVVSTNGEYVPEDFSVRRVWIDKDGNLCFSEYTSDEDYDAIYDYTEDDDLLDITDFSYLIDQIAARVEGDDTHNIVNKSFAFCGYVAEYSLVKEVKKTVTV